MRTVLILLVAMLDGCAAVEPRSTNPAQGAPDMHNSRNALDWAGVYKGVLPCADCPDMATEQAFMRVLEQADKYSVTDGILSLSQARMTPLVRFEAKPGD